MPRFIDRVVLNVKAGSGGHGCASVLREKFRPLGGPDGGNGGHGGSVILETSSQVHTLLDLHFRSHIKAANGKPGQGDNKTGASGDDVVCMVPAGTVVLDEDRNVLADLSTPGMRFIAAQGGRGGLGNAALVSKARKAPGFALLGELGEERQLLLELKSMADVGLIGFPSAGKSSLVSVVSAAKPKIAAYPFTTLVPNLGVVSAGNDSFTMADVPGLIPGAADGKGLGLEFLRHIERCAVLAHVVDCACFEPDRDPVSDVRALEAELAQYQDSLQSDIGLSDLRERSRVIILNKIDMPDGTDMAQMTRDQLEKEFGWPIFEISALTRTGLSPLLFALADIVNKYRQEQAEHQPQVVIDLLSRNKVRDESFTITIDPDAEDSFIVRGVLPERWVRQTQFDNEEAIGFLADRLARLGVEEQLLKKGATVGSAVTIGDMTFDFDPTVLAGQSYASSPRGTDIRLESHDRVDASERKLARELRRRERHEQLGTGGKLLRETSPSYPGEPHSGSASSSATPWEHPPTPSDDAF